jgi:hypothetical protein
MKRILCAWLFLLSMWVLIGCASEVGVTATAVAVTDQPTLAATSPPAPAPTAIIEPTPVPTQVEPTEEPVVPEPTIEPTLEPTSAPDEAAARLIVANYKGIFVISADGTQVSQLFADQVAIGTEAYGWQTAFSPDGRYLAFTTPADIPTTLQLLDTHTGTIERITPLFNEETEVRPEDDCLGEDNFSNRCQAAFTVGEVAWSPDGTKLAFVSAHAGSSSDVYVYELAGQQISQLTTGPTAASRLYWSPDSQTIFHYGIEFYSGAGSESIQSGWAVRADGSALVKLHDVLNSQAEIMVGWQDAETIVVYSLAPGFCGVDLRAHNVQTARTPPTTAARTSPYQCTQDDSARAYTR